MQTTLHSPGSSISLPQANAYYWKDLHHMAYLGRYTFFLGKIKQIIMVKAQFTCSFRIIHTANMVIAIVFGETSTMHTLIFWYR